MSEEEQNKLILSRLMGIDAGNILNGVVVESIPGGVNARFNERVSWTNPKLIGVETGGRSEASSLPAAFIQAKFGKETDILRMREGIKSNDFGGMLVGALNYQLLNTLSSASDIYDLLPK